MGHYRITIDGHGQHHNNQAGDAENLASDFVEQLKRRGHTVGSATFALSSHIGADGKAIDYQEPEPIKPPDATIDGAGHGPTHYPVNDLTNLAP